MLCALGTYHLHLTIFQPELSVRSGAFENRNFFFSWPLPVSTSEGWIDDCPLPKNETKVRFGGGSFCNRFKKNSKKSSDMVYLIANAPMEILPQCLPTLLE